MQQKERLEAPSWPRPSFSFSMPPPTSTSLSSLCSVLSSTLHFIVLRAPEYNAQDSDDKPEETQQRGNALLIVIDLTVYRKDPISRFMSSDFSTSSKARPDDSSSLMLLSTKA